MTVLATRRAPYTSAGPRPNNAKPLRGFSKDTYVHFRLKWARMLITNTLRMRRLLLTPLSSQRALQERNWMCWRVRRCGRTVSITWYVTDV